MPGYGRIGISWSLLQVKKKGKNRDTGELTKGPIATLDRRHVRDFTATHRRDKLLHFN
jgi:hypothetical protein